MSSRCDEMEFRLYRKDGGKLFEVMANFKYLGRLLDETENDWPAVRRKIMCER